MGTRNCTFALAVAVIASIACDRGTRDRAPAPPAAESAPAATPAPSPETTTTPEPALTHPVAVGPPPEQLATKLPAAEIRASLPPLPVAPYQLPRPAQGVRLAYEFAGLHPEVLKYVPCFCGCERTGHPHNESCFVAQRDDDGRVVSWDTHGMG